MSATQPGDVFVYPPLPCWTGALHAQPSFADVRIEACCHFTNDYKVFFDDRGGLDAPELIPRGGVKAIDFQGPLNGRLRVAGRSVLMSALDDAIQAHMAHPAASGFDPLTDSLADQAAPYPLREGLATEPIAVPLPWLLGLLALLVGCFVLPHLLVDRTASPRPQAAQTEAQALAASGVR